MDDGVGVAPYGGEEPPVSIDTVIVGGGACGMIAALAASEAGDSVLVLERDPVPRGSTSLSAGLIPAAGTKPQRAKGIEDTPELFAADIQRKAHGEADDAIVDLVTTESGPLVDWLVERHDVPLTLVDDFDYPGHSRRRMHGMPRRSGAELLDHLRGAVEGTVTLLLCDRRVEVLHVDTDGRVRMVTAALPDGSREAVGCGRLILACNGFGGNRAMVRELMPEIADAVWFGHDGNQGEAIRWGRALGAELRHLGAYQGHGSVAKPHGILISWAVIGEGGIQVNFDANRFWNEAQGYSEAARQVLAQPGGIAWDIFDDRIAGIARQFEDFRQAEAAGAIVAANSIEALATACQLPPASLAATAAGVAGMKAGAVADPLGRDFTGAPPLVAPFRAVRVTGALFHTQGGLAIDRDARVRRAEGGVFANLYAAGGAACGVSGSGDAGYLSGNGLLTATTLGRVAGRSRRWLES
ncbi:MAG: FAD-dependent oxidoreductase [Azospirillaceae bacterium]